jgi:hypothetical protein
MKYGRTGYAAVRGNGDARRNCTHTGEQMLAEGKDIKRCAGRGSHLLVAEKKNLRKMGVEVKRNIANGILPPSVLLLFKS